MRNLSLVSLFLFATLFASCGGDKPTAAANGATTSAPADTTATEAAAPGDSEGNYPKPKSHAEINKIEAQWEKASKNEKAFFATNRLVKYMSALKDSMDEDGMPVNGKITDAQFASLKVKEHMYYIMFHPEEWSQNCAEMMFASGLVQGICWELPFMGDGSYRSTRQENALHEAHDSVETYVLNYVRGKEAISRELMWLIYDFDLYKVAPELVRMFNQQKTKDDLLLTTLLLMMEKGQLPELFDSPLYKDYRNDYYKPIPLTKENIQAVLDLAAKL